MRGLRSAWFSMILLVALTEAVYFRPSIWSQGLLGIDYSQLHLRHIVFARQALFGSGHRLPGWYPRELLGAPFAANIQSFPWIPTRLVLLLFDPKLAYAAGVAMAAALASIFTYLFCKRVGLSDVGAICAGWTFACAGFFASRVMAGHLPLLEAYPALPLLLWLADRAVAPDRARYQARDLAGMALGAACMALAGHPQLPAYAVAAAFLYLIVRSHGRRLVAAVTALALGLGLALFALYPMALLIGRSTRVLSLAAAANDIAMPYRRLLALIWPGRDGWPAQLNLPGERLFNGYPNLAYFWDTASYVGLLPLAGILFLLVRALVTKRLPDRPFTFLAIVGAGAFLLALPVSHPIYDLIPGTFLRSPARLFYVCTFSASVALGYAVSLLMTVKWISAWIIRSLLLVCLIGHAADLGGFVRLFIQPADGYDFPQSFREILDRDLGNARIASQDPEVHEMYDDSGIFDSILLANSYRAVTGLAGFPPGFNEQRIIASELPVSALQATGVRFVITSGRRGDLDLVSSTDEENLYRVPDPFPRTAFFGGQQVDFVPSGAALGAFLSEPRRDRLLLPLDAGRGYTSESDLAVIERSGRRVETKYSRPSSDQIRIATAPDRPGFVGLLESYDPGWRATVDGVPAPVEMANGFSMAVPVKAGQHLVILRYSTPGRGTGVLLSLACAGLLVALLMMMKPKNQSPA